MVYWWRHTSISIYREKVNKIRFKYNLIKDVHLQCRVAAGLVDQGTTNETQSKLVLSLLVWLTRRRRRCQGYGLKWYNRWGSRLSLASVSRRSCSQLTQVVNVCNVWGIEQVQMSHFAPIGQNWYQTWAKMNRKLIF